MTQLPLVSLIAMLACAPALTACKWTLLSPTPDDDRRRQVRDLKEEVKELEAKRTELKENIAQLTKPIAESSTRDAEIVEATPLLVGVTISGHFGPSKSTAQTPNGSAESAPVTGCEAVISLYPSDGRDRFLQIVGRASVSVFQLGADGKSQNLGQRDYSPVEVRDAWRMGLGWGGTHYTLEVPLEATGWKCEGTVTVKLEFTDGITGNKFDAQCEMTTPKRGSDEK